MAKKRKVSADNIRGKKKSGVTKCNPFEVKVNRQKHNVLGKKISKYEKGRPGVSRSQANKKRKETLLVEFQKRGKANKLVDRRLGENDPEMSTEDKMLQRFALERQKHHEKADVFNLNEDEDLTHYGQSLAEIEKFEQPESDSDEEGQTGNIGGHIVSEEHFGGGMLSKKSEEDQKKSWKERMEEIISQSKKQKFERQNEKEKTLVMTEKLDEEWKDIRFLVGASKKSEDATEAETHSVNKADDYDITVRELMFEAKGKPSDRLKTEEELAKEEKERLDELEADRLRRMRGITEPGEDKTKHISADDLDDGFALGKVKTGIQVAYKDGKMITPEGEGHESDEEEHDSEEEMEEDDVSSLEKSDEDEDEDGNVENEEGMDAMSDLESDVEEEELEEDSEGSRESEGKQEQVSTRSRQDILAELKTKKAIMESARKELPYTFDVPYTYEALLGQLNGHTDNDQLVILDRMLKYNHLSLAEENKPKLQCLFSYLLEYCGDLCLASPPQLQLLDKLVPSLYKLAQMFPSEAGSRVREAVIEHQAQFQQICDGRGGRGRFPSLDTLILLKLVSVLFPTSDFKHPVVTPAMLFMSQIITQCPITSCEDVAAGLFVCNLFLEYVSYSKRFVPEVPNFLSGVLFLASKKDPKKLAPVIPPFKPVGKNTDLLLTESKQYIEEIPPLPIGQIWYEKSDLDLEVFRISAINHCLRLTLEFGELYQPLPSYLEIMQPINHFCKHLPLEKYPNALKGLVKEVQEILTKESPIAKEPLVLEKRRPKAFKMYEPVFEESFEDRRKRGKNRDLNEKQRLLHKHKKEMKGAKREIRKDNVFLAKEKFKMAMMRDMERQQKTKAIMAALAQQEGDYNALKRMKNKAD